MADGSAIERWYSAAELAGLPGVPGTLSGVIRAAKRDGWTSRPRAARGGGNEYLLSALPPETQAALLLRERPSIAAAPAAPRRPAWDDFNAAPDNLKALAQQRVTALHAVEARCAGGVLLMDARKEIARAMQRDGLKGASVASLGRWAKMVEGADRADWLVLLLPGYAGNTSSAEIPPPALDFYLGHYLTRARPSHSSTYRRVQEMATVHGWSIPSPATFRRREQRMVSEYSRVRGRAGPVAAAALLPRWRRDEMVFAAGEAVNGDGLKFDRLRVRFADGEIVDTATVWFWQDVRTRRILAWRLAKTENTDLFRLATYDLTGVCAPLHAWMDNTLVAANKMMTAGAAGRHRYKCDPEDGLGLLLMLGIEPHFTNPDKETGSPGAKPIERAFGIGGLHSEVATHPRIVAAGGHNQANPVSEELLREILTVEVARFNARAKRRTRACRGVMSFDEAWQASIAEQPVRVLSTAQRSLFLMHREVVRAHRETGMLTIKAGRWEHGANSFWCNKMPDVAGRKLAVHFDPDDIRAGAHIYTLDGRYLFHADHQAQGQPFNSADAGREVGKLRKRNLKHLKGIAANDVLRSKKERAALYDAVDPPTPPVAPSAVPNVIEGHFQRVPNPAADAARLERTGTDDGPSELDILMFERRPKKGDDGL